MLFPHPASCLRKVISAWAMGHAPLSTFLFYFFRPSEVAENFAPSTNHFEVWDKHCMVLFFFKLEENNAYIQISWTVFCTQLSYQTDPNHNLTQLFQKAVLFLLQMWTRKAISIGSIGRSLDVSSSCSALVSNLEYTMVTCSMIETLKLN